ncbi:hypothetical protein PFISCL1PPCAC_24861, partial [Pristionchus fissidentatus]
KKREEEARRKEEARREKIRKEEEANRRELEKKREEMRRKELEIEEMAEKQRREAVEKKVRELKERKAAESRRVAEEKRKEEERRRKEEEERRRIEEEEREKIEEKRRRKEAEDRIRREEREKFEREEREREEKQRLRAEVKKRTEEAEKRREEEIRAEVRREIEAKMRREYGPSARRNVKVSKVLSNYSDREKKARARLDKLRRPFKDQHELRVLKVQPGGGDFDMSVEERTKKDDVDPIVPDFTEEFTLSPIEKKRNLKAVDELQSLLLEKTDEPFAAARGIRTATSPLVKTLNGDKISTGAKIVPIKSETEDSETFLGGWDYDRNENTPSARPAKGLNVRRITKSPIDSTIAPLEIIPSAPTNGDDASKIVEIIEPTTTESSINKISVLAPIDAKHARPVVVTPPTTSPSTTTAPTTTKKAAEPGERTVDSLSDAEYDKFVRDYYSTYYKEYYSKLGLPSNDST